MLGNREVLTGDGELTPKGCLRRDIKVASHDRSSDEGRTRATRNDREKRARWVAEAAAVTASLLGGRQNGEGHIPSFPEAASSLLPPTPDTCPCNNTTQATAGGDLIPVLSSLITSPVTKDRRGAKKNVYTHTHIEQQ